MPSDLTIKKFEQPQTPDPRSRVDQVREAREKVALYQTEPMTLITEDIPRSLKENARDIAAGPVASALGWTADLIALGTTVGYSGFNKLVRGGDFTFPDFADIPATADWYGREVLGADPESLAFMSSSLLNPLDFVKGTKIPTSDQLSRIVAGEKAITTADEDTALAAAKVLKQTNPDLHDFEIWQNTGWWQDAEGAWRMYIPPNDFAVNADVIETAKINILPRLAEGEVGSEAVRLGSLVQYDKLWERYPQLKDKAVRLHFQKVDGELIPLSTGVAGQIDEAGHIDLMDALKSEDSIEEVLRHEIQHGVQQFEGLSAGANGTAWRQLATDMTEYAKPERTLKYVMDNADEMLDMDLTDDRYMELIEEFIKREGVDPEQLTLDEWGKQFDRARGLMESFVQILVDVPEDELASVSKDILSTLRQGASMRESFDMDMAMLALRTMDEAEVEEVIKQTPLITLRRLVTSGYWDNKGEVEARIAGELRDKGEDWFKQNRIVPTDAGTELRRPVQPGDEIIE